WIMQCHNTDVILDTEENLLKRMLPNFFDYSFSHINLPPHNVRGKQPRVHHGTWDVQSRLTTLPAHADFFPANWLHRIPLQYNGHPCAWWLPLRRDPAPVRYARSCLS